MVSRFELLELKARAVMVMDAVEKYGPGSDIVFELYESLESYCNPARIVDIVDELLTNERSN